MNHLRRATGPADLPDAELLGRFTRERDGDAFAALVRRHGPMVLGVCRRILGHHDAEDACQTAFLILARKANGLTGRASVAGWLCSVARNAARKARRASARRAAREAKAVSPARTEPNIGLADLCAALDAEVARLPDTEREAFTVCVLEGLSKSRAARRLGWTEGTVSGRLARARERLRVRLARRGITLSAAMTAVALAGPAEAIAPALVTAAVRRACEPVARGTLVGSTRSVAAALIAGTALTAGVAGWLSRSPHGAGQSKPPAANPPTTKGAAGPHVDFVGDALPDRAIARIGHQRFRHEGAVAGIAVTPDSKTIASATTEGVIRLWEADTGKLLRSWEAKTRYHEAGLRFLGRGDRLFVGIQGDTIPPHIADVATGKVLWKAIEETDPERKKFPGEAILSDDEKLLLEYWGEGTVRVVERDAGKVRFDKKLVDPAKGPFICHVRFLPDGKKFLMVLGGESSVWECSADSGAVVRKYDIDLPFPFVAVSADGRFFAAAQRGDSRRPDPRDTVVVWDRQKNEKVCTVERLFPAPVCLAFSPDGKTFAIGSQGSDVALLNTGDGSEVRKFPWHPSCVSLAFSSDGKLLVGGNSGGQIARWDVATGKLLPVLPVTTPDSLYRAEFTRGGGEVLTYGDAIAWWDAATGKPLRILADSPPYYSGASVSPDGKTIAFHKYDGAAKKHTVRVRDVATSRERVLTDQLGGPPASLRYSADGVRLVVAGRFTPIVRVLDAATGGVLHELNDHHRYVDHAMFSPDGRRIVSFGTDANANGDHDVRVWDAETGKLLHKLAPVRGSAFEADFTSDGRFLVFAGGDPGRPNPKGEIHLWDLDTGKLIRVWDGHKERVTCVAVSPDGRSIVTGSLDRTLRLWDLATGRLRHEFTGHRAYVTSVAFAPDGRRFVACSADAPGYVWDLYGHLTATPASLSADDFLRVWIDLADADPAVGFRAVCRLAAAGDGAVSHLRSVLKPVPTADAAKVERWIADLGADRFAVREQAAAELAKVADQIRPRLRKALDAELTAEARERVTKLLAAADGDEPDYRRARRGCEVLEAIGTADARRLAGKLATGAAGARLTTEAKASRDRLGK
jgi:RNA polymerase sigma factor (sigma-70 family)